MSNKRKLVLSSVLLFVIVYLSFGAWIAHDTRIILKEAMSQDANRKYMNSSAFESINPIERGMTADSFKYNQSSHHIGIVLPLHYFAGSKVYVTQKYENDNFAFKEPVQLTLKLKSGKWYATKVSIQP
ncbi:hypothetical protein KDC22_23455 [Paenibacillus tritici]|uniref:hypothetical protein n=1 Tax=Paenibacillus tritici TaxID=1873425 RepID=UPI001BA59A55|nr:hypothetical protein [Paenibacillus tritici]QUL53337.1 hypothetical protein KDC22_23455 [Paenibacillus tritici]